MTGKSTISSGDRGSELFQPAKFPQMIRMSYVLQLWSVPLSTPATPSSSLDTTVAPQKVKNDAILVEPCEETSETCSASDTFRREDGHRLLLRKEAAYFGLRHVEQRDDEELLPQLLGIHGSGDSIGVAVRHARRAASSMAKCSVWERRGWNQAIQNHPAPDVSRVLRRLVDQRSKIGNERLAVGVVSARLQMNGMSSDSLCESPEHLSHKHAIVRFNPFRCFCAQVAIQD
jgi:hypothetical protein